MIKLCLLLFSLSLLARENPFFPINSDLDIPLTLEQNQKAPMLKRATVSLPSTAREIESVIIKYKNLDGSIEEKSIELRNSVDWHLPIFISQNYDLGEDSQTQPKSSVTAKKDKPKKFIKILSLPFISFYVKDQVMKIVTKDRLLRSFLLVKPHRIVCDFERETDLRSFEKKITTAKVFKKITIGTHKGYYRVVIELDGFYKYKIKQDAAGCLVSVH